MLLPAGYNQLLVEVSNGKSVEGLQHIHPAWLFFGLVADRQGDA